MFKIHPVKFQGNAFTVLVLYIQNDTIKIIKKYILKKIKQFPIFLKQAPIVLNLSDFNSFNDIKHVYEEMCNIGLKIIGITGCYNDVLKNNIIKLNIPIFSESIKDIHNINLFNKNNYFEKKKYNITKIVTTPVRSGQTIYAHQSDLIITNHVSAGAEIMADGNIHIYGTMKGRVLAGMNGDITKNIFCTKLFAELISISGEYLLFDQIPTNLLGKGVHIFLKNNILFIYPLS